MKVTRTYPKICDHCYGKGQVWDNPNCTNPYITCPVCKGTGVITVVEEFERDEVIKCEHPDEAVVRDGDNDFCLACNKPSPRKIGSPEITTKDLKE
jgi:DnaJ-class molecular chaperone